MGRIHRGFAEFHTIFNNLNDTIQGLSFKTNFKPVKSLKLFLFSGFNTLMIGKTLKTFLQYKTKLNGTCYDLRSRGMKLRVITSNCNTTLRCGTKIILVCFSIFNIFFQISILTYSMLKQQINIDVTTS